MDDDFQVGDVVVCVDDSPIVCPYDPLVIHDGSLAPKRLCMGRIVAIETGFVDCCDCVVIHTRDGGGIAQHFRKLPKADERFAEQMRALKPRRVTEPA